MTGLVLVAVLEESGLASRVEVAVVASGAAVWSWLSRPLPALGVAVLSWALLNTFLVPPVPHLDLLTVWGGALPRVAVWRW